MKLLLRLCTRYSQAGKAATCTIPILSRKSLYARARTHSLRPALTDHDEQAAQNDFGPHGFWRGPLGDEAS